MMRPRTLALAALPAAAALLALSASPALADTSTYTYPSTPVPTSQSSGEPPASAASGLQPLGHAVGDAATGLAVFRLLPGAVPATSILGPVPNAPAQSLAEAGFGLADARADSEAYLSYEHAIAQSCPAGIAVEGNAPQLPGCLIQTALPDNPNALTTGFSPPSTPLDALVKVGLLDGSAHARWSDGLGPCVGTIADASTSLASVSAVNALSALPAVTNANALSTAMSQSALSPSDKQSLVNSLSQMGPLAALGGLLSGAGTSGTPNSATGSLVSLPNTLGSHSIVQLVGIPGSPNKAVQSVSTMQVASVRLLAGTLMEIDLNVVSQPTLTVTSTGDPKTSSVRYTAPVIQAVQGDKVQFTLDAADPTQDIPIGIPTNLSGLPKLPVVGSLLPNGQPLTSAIPVIDIGVLRLSIAALNQSNQSLTAGQNGAPFTGYQLGATASMLDLQVLPTAALGIPNLPAALAQVSLGEQLGRAYTPTGGVVCASTSAAVGPAAPVRNGMPPLAYTGASYQVVPMFWLGTTLLLTGVILVAALPGQPRSRRSRRSRRQSSTTINPDGGR